MGETDRGFTYPLASFSQTLGSNNSLEGFENGWETFWWSWGLRLEDQVVDNLQTRLPSSGFNFIDDVLWVTVLIKKHLSAAMRRARAVTFVFENSRGNSQKDIQIVGAKNLEIGNPYSGTLGARRPLCVDISVLPIAKNKSQSSFPLAPATA